VGMVEGMQGAGGLVPAMWGLAAGGSLVCTPACCQQPAVGGVTLRSTFLPMVTALVLLCCDQHAA
jgi:hypothetical protein